MLQQELDNKTVGYLDDVDTLDDVDKELEVETLERSKINHYRKHLKNAISYTFSEDFLQLHA